MGRHSLGELQYAIMQILWLRTEATSAEVHKALLKDRGLAPTTINTMLRKMEDKGVVEHRVDGRQFVYRAVVSEAEVKHTMVNEIVERLFAGNPAELVSHLISDALLEPEELDRLRNLIADAEEVDDEHR